MKIIYNLKFKQVGRICSLISKKIINYTLLNKKMVIFLKNSNLIKYNKKSFFYKHTGFPGGLKKISNVFLIKKHGFDFFIKKTLLGMLPKRKKFKDIIKKIIFKNENI
ncbi:50S ribosomal protein L13 [Candidatus Vidania fulgoroideae]|uniref:50S ribosomal protein L13 n=1 Tax=Candidatus Vidania fulgoroideorum TaxID=881286 RepID=A0A346E0C2_9PROT|nr:50S ribosomal protein L13 [Candidatus Vidania fulgoroideae]WDI79372.1 uL13 family ribosomal protein [Candidatus Vidania fulgoroideae]WDR79277.1 uL13 family ribosomal protein [Candidatus Vidania fulgoroideae]